LSNDYTRRSSEILAQIPPDFILILIGALILLVAFYGVFRLNTVRSFSRRLKKEANKIKKSDALNINEMGKSLQEIKPLLDEFQELITEKKRNVENCEGFLSEDNIFRAIGVDEAALEHYPGVFTALGIAGTFIGILFVLVPIAGEIGKSEMLIDRLLQGAGTAFLTSIIGITSSLIFLFLEKHTMGIFKNQLYDFQMAINGKLDRVTTEGVLLEIKEEINTSIKKELMEIKDALETMADDIGIAVSKTIQETLETVGKVLDNSISVASNSSQEIVDKVMGSIDGTLGKFSENLEKMEKSSSIQVEILEQFDKSIKNATILADKLDNIVPAMTSISKDFEISSQRLEKLPDAFIELNKLQEEYTSVAKQSIELMNKNWQTERERLTELTESLQKQFTAFEEGIANGLQSTMSKFDDELSRAGTYVATWLDRLNDDVSDFTKQVNSFNGVVQNNSSDLQDIMKKFSDNLAKQATEMQTNVSLINTALKTGFEEIEFGFKKLPLEISKAVEGIQDIYTTSTEQLPAILAANLNDLAKEVNKTTRKGFHLFGRN